MKKHKVIEVIKLLKKTAGNATTRKATTDSSNIPTKKAK